MALIESLKIPQISWELKKNPSKKKKKKESQQTITEEL